LLLIGCVNSTQGTSMAKYAKSCKVAQWRSPVIVELIGDWSIATCYDQKYHLFSSGVLQRSLEEGEAIAMMEDSQCVRYGATRGTQPYINCRVSLAQVRAQREIASAQQQQAAVQNLLLYGQLLQQASPPAQRINMSCTSTTSGSITSYSCH